MKAPTTQRPRNTYCQWNKPYHLTVITLKLAGSEDEQSRSQASAQVNGKAAVSARFGLHTLVLSVVQYLDSHAPELSMTKMGCWEETVPHGQSDILTSSAWLCLQDNMERTTETELSQPHCPFLPLTG